MLKTAYSKYQIGDAAANSSSNGHMPIKMEAIYSGDPAISGNHFLNSNPFRMIDAIEGSAPLKVFRKLRIGAAVFQLHNRLGDHIQDNHCLRPCDPKQVCRYKVEMFAMLFVLAKQLTDLIGDEQVEGAGCALDFLECVGDPDYGLRQVLAQSRKVGLIQFPHLQAANEATVVQSMS